MKSSEFWESSSIMVISFSNFVLILEKPYRWVCSKFEAFKSLSGQTYACIVNEFMHVYDISKAFQFLLFRHAHYQPGNTPLALVWKDESCSQYVIDTDSKGQVPSQQQVIFHCIPFLHVYIFPCLPSQLVLLCTFYWAVSIHLWNKFYCLTSPAFSFYDQVVLELLDDGKLTTSDDPPVEFGCLDLEFIQKVWHLCSIS